MERLRRRPRPRIRRLRAIPLIRDRQPKNHPVAAVEALAAAADPKAEAVLLVVGGPLAVRLLQHHVWGGFAGYFGGLALYKAQEKKVFGLAATLGVFMLHLMLSLLSSAAFRSGGSAVGLLLFALVLLFGYLTLFGYAIKLKQLERN